VTAAYTLEILTSARDRLDEIRDALIDVVLATDTAATEGAHGDALMALRAARDARLDLNEAIDGLEAEDARGNVKGER